EAAKRDGRTLEALGIAKPAAIDAIVPEYLERFKSKGQFASYRLCKGERRPNAGRLWIKTGENAAASVQRRNCQLVLVRVADGGPQRIGQRDGRTVGRVQREERDALGQTLDHRKHLQRLVRR